MRFYHLLHFLGAAFAAPSKASSLSIFDNPTIPWNASDSLSLPILSHVRRAGTSALTVNVSTCIVTVTMDPYWYNFNQRATLYITSPIDSPGTKNGANKFELFLRVWIDEAPGAFVLTTNEFVMDFGSKPLGPKNADYARTAIGSNGAMLAHVDYANLERPEINSPLKFNLDTSRRTPGAGFASLGVVVAGPKTVISVTVKDKGVMKGEIAVWPLNGGLYTSYFLEGSCFNRVVKLPVSS